MLLTLFCSMFCLPNTRKNTNDTKKCFRRKLYRIDENILCLHLFDLAMALKHPVEVTFQFLNRRRYFLLHILVVDIQTFSKYFKLVSFAKSVIEIRIFKFDVPSALALPNVYYKDR